MREKFFIATNPAKPRHTRLLWTLLSGFLTFCGGLSWEGFGIFVSVIVCVEVYRYLSSGSEADVGYYGIWVLSFVPSLYLASPAYRSGEGWGMHIAAFILVPPVVVLLLRVFRSWLCEKSPWSETLGRYRHQVSLALLLVCLATALVYVVGIRATFSETTVAFGESPLMASIGELVAPTTGTGRSGKREIPPLAGDTP